MNHSTLRDLRMAYEEYVSECKANDMEYYSYTEWRSIRESFEEVGMPYETA